MRVQQEHTWGDQNCVQSIPKAEFSDEYADGK